MIYVMFLVPIITLIAGYLMYKIPSKKINRIVGYRTIKSMKNKKNWQKANKICGKSWIIIGTITFFVSLILYILALVELIVFTEELLTIITLIQVVILLLPIPIVENKITSSHYS